MQRWDRRGEEEAETECQPDDRGDDAEADDGPANELPPTAGPVDEYRGTVRHGEMRMISHWTSDRGATKKGTERSPFFAPSTPANRSPRVEASRSDRSMGASRETSVADICLAARTVSGVSSSSLLISSSVGSRFRTWARMVSARARRMSWEFWLSG